MADDDLTVDDLPDDDPVLAVLEGLEAADKLDPETVVAEAADPSSPLHARFEWDDSAAAHEWRKQQARHLIARFKVVSSTAAGEQFVQRRFTHVPSQGRYYSTDRALRDWREEVMAKARQDLRVFSLKYKRLGLAALRTLAEEELADPSAGEAEAS